MSIIQKDKKNNKNNHKTINFTDSLSKVLETSDLKVSCVIPAYNEESRIENVLKAIKDYKNFHEVIIVNDGSSDGTSRVVNEYISSNNFDFKNWVFIDNETNKGKTGAVIDGVNKASGKIIVLLDADLIGLTHENLDKLLYFIVLEDYSMTILDRRSDRMTVLGFTTYSRFWGGERAFWKEDFLKLDLPKDKKKGYLLEAVLNKFMMDNNKKVLSIFCENLDTVLQTEKRSFIDGTLSYFKMYADIFKYLKLEDSYKQFIYIEDDQSIDLYDLNRKMQMRIGGIVVAGTLLVGAGLFLKLHFKKARRDLEKISKKK